MASLIVSLSSPLNHLHVINIMIKLQQPRASQLVSFLQPFKYTLWILVLVSVKVDIFRLLAIKVF